MIKTVLLDLDGVLVQAVQWHRVALNMSLKQHCNYEIPLDQHLQYYNGLPTRVKLSMLQDKGVIQKANLKLVQQSKQKYTIQIIQKLAQIDNQKIKMLKYLKSKNIKLACVTNSIRKTALLMLSKTGQLQYLDLVISNQDVSRNKPSPEPYLKALQSLQADPLETLVVQDSPNGIQSGRASGCRLWVTTFNIVNLKHIKSEIKKYD